MTIIEARDLVKTYQSRSGEVQALDGLSLSVPEGTVKGLLGPNGAGKTTTVKVLNTLIRPTSGSAQVAGVDVLADPAGVRRVIGASGQYAAVDEHLTGFENLVMVGRLYHLGSRRAKARATELIEVFGLTEAAHRPVKGFSGGMRRRIDLAGALVIKPRILFLDEPTTGLDPRSRLGLWDIIADLVGQGTTVLLTTQYLEEADHLADDISVIDHGRVIAEGTADQLKQQVGGHRIEVVLAHETDRSTAVEILTEHGSGEVRIGGATELAVAVEDGPAQLERVLAGLSERRVALHDIGMRRPTLDDVFLQLTGHVAEVDDSAADAPGDSGHPEDRAGGPTSPATAPDATRTPVK